MSYFVVSLDDDGINVEELTASDLQRRITPDEEGCTYYGGDVNQLEFLSALPESPSDWPRSAKIVPLCIIEGHVVTPVKTEVVTKWELPE